VDGGLGVDPVAEAVDGDVVVVPAEGDEVVGMVVAAVGTLADVAGDGFSPIRICHRVEAVGDDEADLAGAEDL